jgi:tetratricopeptide (TPR) repeat protein
MQEVTGHANAKRSAAVLRPARWTIAAAVAFLLAGGAADPAGGESPLLAQAAALAAKGKFAASAALLRTAEKGDDPFAAELAAARVLRDAGYYFLDDGLFAEALKAGRAALARRDDSVEARFLTALLLYEGGRYREAAELFPAGGEAVEAPSLPQAGPFRRAAAALAERAERQEQAKGQEARQDDAAPDRCDLCWAPLAGTLVQLEDGRRRCASCSADAVNDEAPLEEIRVSVGAFFVAELGITFPKQVALHLVSKTEMARLAGERLSSFAGVTPEDLAGLFAPYPDHLAIYVLRGLPRVETVRVVAHELAHAWVSLECPPGVALGDNEGFSEWVAYRALLAANLQREAAWMFLEPGPYGVHFKRFEVVGRVRGAAQTIAAMREGRL